jgi:hypothetical protein
MTAKKLTTTILAVLLFHNFPSAQVVFKKDSMTYTKNEVFEYGTETKSVFYNLDTFQGISHFDFLKLDTLYFSNCIFKNALTIVSEKPVAIIFDKCSFSNRHLS